MDGGNMKTLRKIPKEWLFEYFKKSGDDYLYLDNLIVTDKGFASFEINEEENAIVLLQVYGDGKFWDEFFTDLAKKLNKNKIIIGTKRNPRGFCRKFGFNLVGFILEKEVSDGQCS